MNCLTPIPSFCHVNVDFRFTNMLQLLQLPLQCFSKLQQKTSIMHPPALMILTSYAVTALVFLHAVSSHFLPCFCSVEFMWVYLTHLISPDLTHLLSICCQNSLSHRVLIRWFCMSSLLGARPLYVVTYVLTLTLLVLWLNVLHAMNIIIWNIISGSHTELKDI